MMGKSSLAEWLRGLFALQDKKNGTELVDAAGAEAMLVEDSKESPVVITSVVTTKPEDALLARLNLSNAMLNNMRNSLEFAAIQAVKLAILHCLHHTDSESGDRQVRVLTSTEKHVSYPDTPSVGKLKEIVEEGHRVEIKIDPKTIRLTFSINQQQGGRNSERVLLEGKEACVVSINGKVVLTITRAYFSLQKRPIDPINGS